MHFFAGRLHLVKCANYIVEKASGEATTYYDVIIFVFLTSVLVYFLQCIMPPHFVRCETFNVSQRTNEVALCIVCIYGNHGTISATITSTTVTYSSSAAPFVAFLELNVHTPLAPLSPPSMDASTHFYSWFSVVHAALLTHNTFTK